MYTHPEAFNIIHIGRCVPQKAQHRIIEIAKILKHRALNIHIYILGQGILQSKLEQTSIESDVSDVVHFMGYHDNPYPWLAKADLQLSTSITEGFPMVIIEGLALGTPSLCTDIPGVRETLAQGGGIMCEYSAEKMAGIIETLATDGKSLSALSEEAVKASKGFSVDNTMRQIYELI